MGQDSTMRSEESQQPLQWHYTALDDRNFEIRGKTLFFVVVVFSVLLVLTLLFLYARWACRYRHVSVHQTSVSTSASSSSSRAPPPPKGLDAAAIKGLPVTSHRTAAEERAECCICLGVFEDGERVKVLPRCCHCFHPECVDRWLSSQPSCPLCRNSLRVDSVALKIVVE